MDPCVLGIPRADVAAVPVLCGQLRFPQRPFVEVPSSEPTGDRDAVSVHDRDVDALPVPFGERDHSGDDQQRDADTEPDP
jgi:hypothetical protein